MVLNARLGEGTVALALLSAGQLLGLRQAFGAVMGMEGGGCTESARGLAHSKTWRHTVRPGRRGRKITFGICRFTGAQRPGGGVANSSAMVSWNSGSSFSVSSSCPASMLLSTKPYSLL